MDLEQVEREPRQRLDALGPASRAELLNLLILPDFDLAARIGEFWAYPQSREFAELLIDREEDRTLRAVLGGMLREADRWELSSSGSRRTGSPRRTASPPGLARAEVA